MTLPVLDLRSDFVARPTPQMVAFASAAAQRPAAFLPWADPLVQELQSTGAALFGRQHATFTINCTTANYLALCHHAAAVDCVVLSADSHIVRNEGRLLRISAQDREVIVTHDAEGAAKAALARGRRVLLALENSQLYRCGRALDLADLARCRALKVGAAGRLAVHLDGSRIFNAQAAAGYDLCRDFDFVDSLAFSLNKGLAAPIGALLVGAPELIDAANAQALAEARFVRPAHIPAAYGLAALRQTLSDLAEDNRRTAALAQALDGRTAARVEYGGTNILFLCWDAPGPAEQLVRGLEQRGILARQFRDAATVRLVFHRDIDDLGLARLERELLAACGVRA